MKINLEEESLFKKKKIEVEGNKKYDFLYINLYLKSYFFIINFISFNYDINNSLTINNPPKIIIIHEIGLLSSLFENRL